MTFLSDVTTTPMSFSTTNEKDIALHLLNGACAPLDTLPIVAWDIFTAWLLQKVGTGGRLSTLFILPKEDLSNRGSTLVAVVASNHDKYLSLLATPISGGFSSLTSTIPAASVFERILCEEDGLLPAGHPWLKPIRFSRLPEEGGPDVGIMDFYRVEGNDVHEVGVGPVHAGVIECGHFRFQCISEIVMHLEISLGYHHRGVTKLLHGGPHKRTLPLMEVVAGDSTIAHSWACSTVIEALDRLHTPLRSQLIRSLALELERLANHTGDLGALAGDAGFLPTAAYCGRLRGDWLNTTAYLCGNRFGRGLIRPGGTLFDIDSELISVVRKRIIDTAQDVDGAVNLLWGSSSFMARVSELGQVSKEDTLALGVVGPAARACGMRIDSRTNHPLTGLPDAPILQTQEYGDVLSRAIIRHKEIQAAVTYCLRLLDIFFQENNESPITTSQSHEMLPNHLAIALIEGFRGEVCHIGVTDTNGTFAKYDIVDPSVHNWPALAMALRNQQISDFPLCNKSFNLSYCGHDL